MAVALAAIAAAVQRSELGQEALVGMRAQVAMAEQLVPTEQPALAAAQEGAADQMERLILALVAAELEL